MAGSDISNQSGLLVAELASRRQIDDRCPACDAPADTPTLLTSMVRYYDCSRCARTWQVLRLEDPPSAPSPALHARITSTEHPMSAPQWRWSLIGAWLALTCMIFIAGGRIVTDRWLLLLVVGVVPPAMLLWLWNEDRPVPIGALSRRRQP